MLRLLPGPSRDFLQFNRIPLVMPAGGGLYAYKKKGSKASLYASSAVRVLPAAICQSGAAFAAIPQRSIMQARQRGLQASKVALCALLTAHCRLQVGICLLAAVWQMEVYPQAGMGIALGESPVGTPICCCLGHFSWKGQAALPFAMRLSSSRTLRGALMQLRSACHQRVVD